MRFALSMMAIVIAGCATNYKADGLAGGFSETQLAPNIWRVNFRGNGYTRDDRASDMAMLRSADLTLLNGFTHFALLDEKTSSRVAAFTGPGTATTTGSASLVGNSLYGQSTTRFTSGQTVFVKFPSANNTVVMFKEKPADVSVAFDAQFVCNSLGKKYEVTCEALKSK